LSRFAVIEAVPAMRTPERAVEHLLESLFSGRRHHQFIGRVPGKPVQPRVLPSVAVPPEQSATVVPEVKTKWVSVAQQFGGGRGSRYDQRRCCTLISLVNGRIVSKFHHDL
jgi:hypothetical protein